MKRIALYILAIISILSQSAVANTAHESLYRVFADSANRFDLILSDSDETGDWYQVSIRNNRIQVTGNSPVALCKGAYSFIEGNGYGLMTWEGTRVDIPSQLEDKVYDRIDSSVPLRMYLNPCTYGYTMAWWNWERWEKELDWMAMHGINMPLVLLGQEAIWQQVWEELGIGHSELTDYHCGPAFLPWFRMGNIYNHHGPLPQTWIDKDKALQLKIMKRIKELEMSPIVPAFSGHVPPAFVKKYPESKTYRLAHWGGLEPEKASYLLDPKDPLFAVIGKKFLECYEETYGQANMFLADSFNEMLPPVSKENKNAELAEYGEAIYQGIKGHDPDATWVLQGWTFGHQHYFWTPESTRAFLSKIPKDKVLMLNYGEDRYPLWKKLESFYGYKWTYGYVHNYGGQQSLFGDFNFYRNQYKKLMADPNKGNLVGYGCLPEAIENNSIVYEYIFDIPWGATSEPVQDWVYHYLDGRYGKVTPKVEEAWEIAVGNTYTVKEWKTSHLGYGTYIHNNRPNLDINIGMFHGNPQALSQILKLLLEDYDQYESSDLYYYDILDFAQHYTAYLADLHLLKAAMSYKNNDYANGDLEFAKTKQYLEYLESLQVATGGSFTQWCEDAVSLAETNDQRSLYLKNAKAQITLWGGNRLKDYASKSWSGLLLDFYYPRWELFFNDLKNKGDDFDEIISREAINKWEEKWIENPSIPSSPALMEKNEYLELVKHILKE
ncbi:alpha-N-acetylglucosaminidase [Rubellicoccus peritrichatus]|uniref:Alpha-N-acetylglucosaminidase n=1 Tax=Rubellicoccus peritrichatus TaxID=3080537 RepID=A0AAQ3L6U7_9BACT|nr:alpha-N-acetylglucosaminidase [Puniceicoccus sp. CR14]WOO40634.1 alpha-N-acetylglucosaminidase [Puniceicoccus sp. CR14]